VRLTDGRSVEAHEPDGRGGPARPLPEGAIVEKFRRNAARALPDTRVAALERAASGRREMHQAMSSLKELIEKNHGVNERPEQFCFGLLEAFDLPQLQMLADAWRTGGAG
jgi:hypothetical protein